MSRRRIASARTAIARTAALLATAFLCLPPAFADGLDCAPDAEPLTSGQMAAGMRDATDHGLLWKATRGGHASYLYGTIHVARRDWIFPGPHELAALRASDEVALELDPTDPDVVARLQRDIVQRAEAPELPRELDTRLRAQMVAACIEPSALDGLRPEMRAITLVVLSGRRLGLYPGYGVDAFLAQSSRQLKKPVRSLETPEAQAALLVSDDPAETARTVETILDELENGTGRRVLARLANDWRDGDLDDLSAYGDWCDCLATPEQRADFKHLVGDRNAAMATHIAKWHDEGRSLFVAVGSLHMIGPGGLPALLQAQGFDVVRVRADGDAATQRH